ncbi:hypothetical protein [Jannaschia sp. W003]|uniref:hypothetical protein n=1 Tax=Jannaschia sp. W003 TaxID=2867012 RepID=UPI0021A6FA27|nr:hypothetical protein [Jannaschia sp. W003]UWQ20304.1 hypothetical protein K3554_09865 [Jannaschia sp. W003]
MKLSIRSITASPLALALAASCGLAAATPASAQRITRMTCHQALQLGPGFIRVEAHARCVGLLSNIGDREAAQRMATYLQLAPARGNRRGTGQGGGSVTQAARGSNDAARDRQRTFAADRSDDRSGGGFSAGGRSTASASAGGQTNASGRTNASVQASAGGGTRDTGGTASSRQGTRVSVGAARTGSGVSAGIRADTGGGTRSTGVSASATRGTGTSADVQATAKGTSVARVGAGRGSDGRSSDPVVDVQAGRQASGRMVDVSLAQQDKPAEVNVDAGVAKASVGVGLN